jgi:uncharacterized membrane protein (DUF2068 family)
VSQPAQTEASVRISRTDAGKTGATALWLIGCFKLTKGLLLVAVAIGALHLLHKDVADVVATWVTHVYVDPDNRYVDRVLSTLSSLDERKLKAISAGAFLYSALLLTEGTGLLLRQRWAEYFTVVVTGSFIPLELYELARHVTVSRLIVISINVAIVWYLIVTLHRGGGERTSHAPSEEA